VKKFALLLLLSSLAAFRRRWLPAAIQRQDLDGWDGDPRLWNVRDGMIVGSTENAKLTHNEFLIQQAIVR